MMNAQETTIHAKTVTDNVLVYVSILNWHDYESTIRCVQMVEALSYPNKVIVVVDNHSTNDSVKQIRAALPHIHLIESPVNNGYAAGHRLTVELAQQDGADLIWLLNTDIEFEDDNVLSSLVEAYQTYGDAIYGSLILQPGTDGFPKLFYYYSRNSSFFFLQKEGEVQEVYNKNEPYYVQQPVEQPIPVDVVFGSSYLLPIELINLYGFLDESLFLYGEEHEYSYRLSSYNVQTYVIPQSRVWHESQGVAGERLWLRMVMNYYRHRNSMVMLRQRKGWFAFLKYMIRPYFFYLVLRFLGGYFMKSRMDDATFSQYIYFCAGRDALLGRMGKTLNPEDYL